MIYTHHADAHHRRAHRGSRMRRGIDERHVTVQPQVAAHGAHRAPDPGMTVLPTCQPNNHSVRRDRASAESSAH